MKFLKPIFCIIALFAFLLSFTPQQKHKHSIQNSDNYNLNDNDTKLSQVNFFELIEIENLEFIEDDILDSVIRIAAFLSFGIFLFSFLRIPLNSTSSSKQYHNFISIRSKQSYLQVFKV